MRQEIESLLSLQVAEIHEVARRRARAFANTRWELMVCLLAIERREVHVQHECSSVGQYAERFLGVDAYRASEMLRVAKLLEHLPELSTAFRAGSISWTSIREITRHAQPETDAEWAEMGRTLTTRQIEQRCLRSPQAWEREQRERARPEQPQLPELVPASAPASDLACAESGSVDASSGPPPRVVESLPGILEQPEGFANAQPDLGATTLPGGRTPHIGLTLRLTPEQYQLYKEVDRAVRATRRGTATREEVFEEMCRRALAGGGKKGRTRHVIVLHLAPQTRTAWVDTDRGIVPVDPASVEVAMVRGSVVVAPHESMSAPTTDLGADASTPEGNQDADGASTVGGEGPQPDARAAGLAGDETSLAESEVERSPRPGTRTSSRRRKRGRRRLSSATLIALYARSNGRCEACGRTGYLQVHHGKPTSRGGDDSLDSVRLMCSACHSLSHRRDFAEDPSWSAARERARSARERVTAPVPAGPPDG